ncbi:FMN-binding protein [Arthrobacter sp. NPDC090010]|uniref:FMN-binding protein n=1 Tax=Arthrobacter sp. NPDC090010 TaxID=3363942 RepID=UPI003810CD37
MRARTALGGVLSSAAILLGAWSMSKAPATHGAAAAAVVPSATSSAAAGNGTASSGATVAPTPSAVTSSGASSTSGATGTFTGSTVQTQYGNVQVQVVMSKGTITDVVALQLTDRDGRSQQISSMAAPILRQEVLAAQSGSVDTVSGATYTSEGYLQSLQSALDQAH